MSCDFSPVAKIYEGLGKLCFASALQRAQKTFLDQIPNNSSILICGGGTGTSLVELLRLAPQSQITYIDISPGMIAQAKKKVEQELGAETLGQVDFICVDLLTYELPDYDYCIAQFFLDCFNADELLELNQKLAKASQRGILIADFNVHSWRARLWSSLLYPCFNLLCGLKSRTLEDYFLPFQDLDFHIDKEVFLCGNAFRVIFMRRQR